MFLVNIGLLLVTAVATLATLVATGFAVWRGLSAKDAELGAIEAQKAALAHAAAANVQAAAAVDAANSARAQAFAAGDAAGSAKKQASAAEDAAGSAKKQASAAEDSAGSAQRQATAAESRVAQTDDHRAQDRRADGIIELANLLIADADTMVRVIDQSIDNLRALKKREPAPHTVRITQLDRFRNNAYYVRAQALLAGDTPAVANWVLAETNRIYEEGTQVLAETGDPGNASGPARSLVMAIATQATEKLFAWQRGELPDQWFIDQVSKS